MEVRVKVTANVRRESVEEGKDGRLIVSLSAPRVGGQANARLVEILAARYAVAKNRVRIVRGLTRSSKTVSILLPD